MVGNGFTAASTRSVPDSICEPSAARNVYWYSELFSDMQRTSIRAASDPLCSAHVRDSGKTARRELLANGSHTSVWYADVRHSASNTPRPPALRNASGLTALGLVNPSLREKSFTWKCVIA